MMTSNVDDDDDDDGLATATQSVATSFSESAKNTSKQNVKIKMNSVFTQFRFIIQHKLHATADFIGYKVEYWH